MLHAKALFDHDSIEGGTLFAVEQRGLCIVKYLGSDGRVEFAIKLLHQLSATQNHP